ncbi:hypothetical protein Tco_0893332 [Tanacetum coccineum]|uniref:Uncharacterized protein n=1 Tax=Tanacetum coccineum TaxID=301880 RepID=A0ABQ5C8J1_9ASTR
MGEGSAMGKGSAMPTDPYHTPIITQPSSSQPQKKQKSRRSKRKDFEVPQPSDPTNVADEAVNEEPSLGNYKFETESQEGRKIDDIDADAEITLVDKTQERYRDEDMFGVHNLDGDELVVGSKVTNKAGEKRNIVEEVVAVIVPVSVATISNVELTLAQTLAELKSARPKTKGVVMQEPSESTPTISLQLPSQAKGQGSKDKGKAKMIEQEKPLKKKDQIKFDEEEALRLQAKFDEKDRLAKEKAQQVEESNIGNETKEESSSKRAGDELEQEKAKNQKVDDDQEATKMKELMKIVPDEEEVAVDAIPLAKASKHC